MIQFSKKFQSLIPILIFSISIQGCYSDTSDRVLASVENAVTSNPEFERKIRTQQKRECSFKSDNKELEKNDDAIKTLALFSPKDGPKAFDIIFEEISNAQEYVYITIYSWKLDGVRESALKACENGAKVYIVMDKRHESKAKSDIKELEESNCAEIRRTTKTMHEKFVIVDDHFLVNSSANFSSGAKYKYNESFVFMCDDNNTWGIEDDMIQQFKHEFAVLWNSGKDTKHDKNGSSNLTPEYLGKGDENKILYPPKGCKEACLYSSSTNFRYKVDKDLGIKLYTIKSARKVEDQMVEVIENATKTLYMSVNYLLLPRLCEKIEDAIERGVDVKVVNDNKGVKDWDDCTVQLSQKYPELFRYKFYSFFPNARKALLNHNKYFIADYDPKSKTPISSRTVLVAGSHNFSETAEKKQFDSMVIYRTMKFSNLYEAFYKDFDALFNLGRDEMKKRREEILEGRNNYFRIHQSNDDNLISLTKDEIDDLKKDLLKKAPGMLDRDVPRETLENCDFYNPETGKYYVYEGEMKVCTK